MFKMILVLVSISGTSQEIEFGREFYDVGSCISVAADVQNKVNMNVIDGERAHVLCVKKEGDNE